MKAVFLVISTSPTGDKNVVAMHDYDLEHAVEVFYTLGAAWQWKQELQYTFPDSELEYSIKRVEL